LADYLLPIADREPLAWIVAEQRTAVSERRRREAETLEPGDRLFLYTTRGCFRNPTRDRGRVIGIAEVTRRARELDDPVRFGSREYPIEIALRIESLAPRGAGVELTSLLDRLESFPNKRAWSAYMRRALVPLAQRDGATIAGALRRATRPYRESADSYA
jgi:hypothetical protein